MCFHRVIHVTTMLAFQGGPRHLDENLLELFLAAGPAAGVHIVATGVLLRVVLNVPALTDVHLLLLLLHKSQSYTCGGENTRVRFGESSQRHGYTWRRLTA